MQALRLHSVELLRLALKEYALVLERDPALVREAKLLESTHFGVQLPGTGLQSIFNSMFGAAVTR